MIEISVEAEIPPVDPTKQGIPYQEAHRVDSNLLQRHTYDMMYTIFEGQTLLAQKYEDQERTNGEPMPTMGDWGDLDSRTVQMRLQSLFGYMVREFGEAVQHLDAKPWKQNYRPVHREKFVEEVADTLHFFVEFCLVAGIHPRELFTTYFKKWEKNRDRQASGY